MPARSCTQDALLRPDGRDVLAVFGDPGHGGHQLPPHRVQLRTSSADCQRTVTPTGHHLPHRVRRPGPADQHVGGHRRHADERLLVPDQHGRDRPGEGERERVRRSGLGSATVTSVTASSATPWRIPAAVAADRGGRTIPTTGEIAWSRPRPAWRRASPRRSTGRSPTQSTTTWAQSIVSEMYDGDGLTITADTNSDGVPDRPAPALCGPSPRRASTSWAACTRPRCSASIRRTATSRRIR